MIKDRSIFLVFRRLWKGTKEVFFDICVKDGLFSFFFRIVIACTVVCFVMELVACSRILNSSF